MRRRRPEPGNRVRIIGGRWRGSRLVFPADAALRPTPDRVRETLFNWLMPVLPGARCLDLFAGSGVLGLEAASRGAAEVVLVEQDAAAVEALEATVRRLGADQVHVVRADAPGWLDRAVGVGFDLVFLDPPFRRPELLARCLELLSGGERLRAGGLVYVECPRTAQGKLPAGFTEYRAREAGQVRYALLRWEGPSAE